MPRFAPGLAAALVAGLAAGCVTADYDRFRRDTPLPDAAWSGLEPGRASLEDCLAALGAPKRVWEPRPGALALAWTWSDREGWGLSVSVPAGDAADVSFSYRDALAGEEGLLVVLDETWTVESIERGPVAEVLAASATLSVIEG